MLFVSARRYPSVTIARVTELIAGVTELIGRVTELIALLSSNFLRFNRDQKIDSLFKHFQNLCRFSFEI